LDQKYFEKQKAKFKLLGEPTASTIKVEKLRRSQKK
jgi:hypothetical protein